MARSDGASLPIPLLIAVRAALAGVASGVVLLGHTRATLTPLYAVVAGSAVVYLVVRGDAIFESAVAYLTSPTMRWRWLFLAWAIVSLLWTVRGGPALGRVQTLLEVHVLGLILFDAACSLSHADWVLDSIFAATFAGTAHALLTGIVDRSGRVEGLFGNANVLATTALAGLAVFHAGGGPRRSVVSQAASHAMAAVLALGVLASSSRKGMVGLLILLGVALIVRETRRRALVQSVVLAGVGAALVPAVEPLLGYWGMTKARAAQVLVSMSSLADASASFIQRSRFVREGLALFNDSPIFGRGLESFSWLSGEGTYAHSNVIEIGVSLGVVGLALYYGFFAALFIRAWRANRPGGMLRRFTLLYVPLVVLLDFATVSYYAKLPAVLAVTAAGWVACIAGAPVVRRLSVRPEGATR